MAIVRDRLKGLSATQRILALQGDDRDPSDLVKQSSIQWLAAGEAEDAPGTTIGKTLLDPPGDPGTERRNSMVRLSASAVPIHRGPSDLASRGSRPIARPVSKPPKTSFLSVEVKSLSDKG